PAAAHRLRQASAATRHARLVTRAAILAASKMAELESLAYAVGEDGGDVRDDGLSESPDGSLTDDVPEYCEWFDSEGRAIAGDGERPAGALFARRWAIHAVDASGDSLAVPVVCTAGAGPPLAALTPIATRRGR